MAALSAAWELSAPERRDEVASITVYQRGWRLGGKGASSRGPHGRIEEHGLHVWLGYYENAFRLMRECYAQLDRPRTEPASPILRWDDAFVPASTIGLGELHDGAWLHWIADFSENGDRPGEPGVGAQPMTVTELVRRALRLLGDFAGSLVDEERDGSSPVVVSTNPIPPRQQATRNRPAGTLAADGALVAALAALSTASGLTGRLGERTGGDGTSSFLVATLDDVVERLRAHVARRAAEDDGARRTWQFLDLVRTIVRGIVVDRLMERPEGYGAVDHEDYREWLVRHGAAPDTIASPLVRVVYDLVFGYEDGDEHRPRFAAGTGLLLSGKMFFDYRGALFWKMTAGMGDVVFSPLYEALRERGVEFQLFHRVDALRVGSDGHAIEQVDLGVQARMAGGRDAYDPLVEVDGLRCWPATPCTEQLDGLDPGAGVDFESFWCSTPDAGSLALRAGIDFDALVLAIPVGMHRHICADLIANPRTPQWRAMVDHLGTVATQAMQLWLTADETELGWTAPDATTSGYPGAFHTYASMTRLLAKEDWPLGREPRALAYFCHVLATGPPPPLDDVDYPVRELARVRAAAVEFLRREAPQLWRACTRHGDFRWELLAGDDESGGEARLDAQYLRANVDPSDRYVLSLPGSARFRLRADESGYDNLFLAGDWIDSGLNAGCIEAAVVSGVQAANAVRRAPLLERVAGFYPSHASAGPRPWTATTTDARS